jgi:hypothetical protein
LSMLLFHSAFAFCMPILQVNAWCPCLMSMLHVHVSMLPVHATCLCHLSMLIVHSACHYFLTTSSRRMSVLHDQAVCPRC